MDSRGWAKGFLVAFSFLMSGCSERTPEPPPSGIRTSLSLEPSRVRAGGVLSVEYRWSLEKGWVPPLEGYGVFVHFVDRTGALLFADDHVPSPAPSEWKPDGTYTYRRVVLIPELVPPCSGEVRLGLFSGPRRLALSGIPRGRGEYLGERIEILKRKEDDPVVFGDGFYAPFAPAGDPFVPRRWMGPVAHATFPNHGEDVVVLLRAQTNHAYPKLPHLTLAIHGRGAAVDLPGPDPFSLAVRFRGRDLGAGPSSEVVLRLTESFVPELLGQGDDRRVLSLWVHGLVVEEARALPPSVLGMAEEALPLGRELEVPPLSEPSPGSAGRPAE